MYPFVLCFGLTFMKNIQNSETVWPWRYVGCLFMGTTAGLAFCVLYKETNPVLARCHLIMFIWLPLAAWTPAYTAIIAAVTLPPNFNPGLV